MEQISDIWLQLCGENVGFYLYRDRERIEGLPGVYAWYNPLDCTNESMTTVVEHSRSLSSYDAKSKTTGHWESKDACFNWEPFDVSIKKVAELQALERDKISGIGSTSRELEFTRKKLLLAGTIFTQPLYIGLTRNLAKRYDQHTTYSDVNSFNHRFNLYCIEQQINLCVKDLLFVCLYVRIDMDSSRLGEDKYTQQIDETLRTLEGVLKMVCRPSFGDR